MATAGWWMESVFALHVSSRRSPCAVKQGRSVMFKTHK